MSSCLLWTHVQAESLTLPDAPSQQQKHGHKSMLCSLDTSPSCLVYQAHTKKSVYINPSDIQNIGSLNLPVHFTLCKSTSLKMSSIPPLRVFWKSSSDSCLVSWSCRAHGYPTPPCGLRVNLVAAIPPSWSNHRGFALDGSPRELAWSCASGATLGGDAIRSSLGWAPCAAPRHLQGCPFTQSAQMKRLSLVSSFCLYFGLL